MYKYKNAKMNNESLKNNQTTEESFAKSLKARTTFIDYDQMLEDESQTDPMSVNFFKGKTKSKLNAYKSSKNNESSMKNFSNELHDSSLKNTSCLEEISLLLEQNEMEKKKNQLKECSKNKNNEFFNNKKHKFTLTKRVKTQRKCDTMSSKTMFDKSKQEETNPNVIKIKVEIVTNNIINNNTFAKTPENVFIKNKTKDFFVNSKKKASDFIYQNKTLQHSERKPKNKRSIFQEILKSHVAEIKNEAKFLTEEGALISNFKGINTKTISFSEYLLQLEGIIKNKLDIYKGLINNIKNFK